VIGVMLHSKRHRCDRAGLERSRLEAKPMIVDGSQDT